MNKEVVLRIQILSDEENFYGDNYGSEAADNGHREIFFSTYHANNTLTKFYEWSVAEVKTWTYWEIESVGGWGLVREYFDKKYGSMDLRTSARVLDTFTLDELENAVVARKKNTK